MFLIHVSIASVSCFNTSQWKNVLPEIADAKGLDHWFSFLFSFKKWNVVFNFSICCRWQIFFKSMFSAKGISGVKPFWNCRKNHRRMKFNFLIKNITSNFTKYGAPIARSRRRRCSVKKVFLKISQLSQEHVDAGVFL